MDTKALLESLRRLDIVDRTPTTGRTGEPIEYYVDFKKVCAVPNVLNLAATLLSKKISENVTCIAAGGYGGTPLATLVSVKTNLPLTLVRDTVRAHGTKRLFEGYQPGEDDKVVIIDDLFRTGSNIREISKKITGAGGEAVQALVVIKRGEGDLEIPLIYLIDVEELL